MARRKSKHITSNDPLPCAHAGPNPITISDPNTNFHRSIYDFIHIKTYEGTHWHKSAWECFVDAQIRVGKWGTFIQGLKFVIFS
jgi:hypothetical protein